LSFVLELLHHFVFISKTAARKQDGKEALQNRGSQKRAFMKDGRRNTFPGTVEWQGCRCLLDIERTLA